MKGKNLMIMTSQIKMTSKAINNPSREMTILQRWSLDASLAQDCSSVWRKNIKQQVI